MKTISLEELLEAGCHFGHQVSRQNSKAREFIFEARDGIHIIDLERTKEGLEDAGKFVKELATRGGKLLVLGTKRQMQEVLKDETKKLDKEALDSMYFVNKRWIGGTLTNFSEVSKNYRKLKDTSYRLQDDYEKAKYTKKEIGDWEKSRQKLEGFYGGVSDMTKVPDALFIIDTHLEHVAAQEAKKAGIPVVGIVDTNADPTIIDYPIPANDDAVGSLQLIIGYIFGAWTEGVKAKGVEAVKAAEKAKDDEKKKAADEEAAKKKAEEPKAKPEEKKTVKKDTSSGTAGSASEVKAKPAAKAATPSDKAIVTKKTKKVVEKKDK